MSDNSTPASRLLIADEAELNRLAATFPAWQPIETAPKDGTRILTFGNDVQTAHWFSAVREEEVVVVKGEVLHRIREAYSGWSSFEPTHWMPLPPAPEPTT